MSVGLIGGAYAGRAKAANAQICVNWFVETDRFDAEKRYLARTPGLAQWRNMGVGDLRGFHVYGDQLFVCYQNRFYRVADDLSLVTLGVLGSSNGRVSITDNGATTAKQIAISDGSSLYVYDEDTGTFTTNTDPLFSGSDVLTYMDGYIIWNQPDSDVFQISNLNDATTIFGEAIVQGSPDKLVSVYADHRELWLFGRQTTEVWYNSGDPDFPFERFQGGFTHQGCAAKFTPARIDNTIMWLSRNDRGHGQVVRAREGYRAEVVSPSQINYQISRMATIDDAHAFVYQNEGHEFYQITFPTEDVTYVFDATENEWHQRSSHLGTGQIKRHLADMHAFVYGKHLVGAYDNGVIYEMSDEYLADAGNEIIRERIGRHVRDDRNLRALNELELLFDPGVIGSTVKLRWSKDQGQTWSAWQDRTISSGVNGERAIWRKIGNFRDLLFHVKLSDAADWCLVGDYGR